MPNTKVSIEENAAFGQNAIEARNLQKFYRGQGGGEPKHALKGIDLDIPRGSIFGLLGPNGAGKSTFINILAGLVIKNSGQVRIWGFDIDKNPRKSRVSIGIVPQELSIDPFFTPFDLLDLQAGMYGVPKADRRTAEILEVLGLADKAQAYARTLSGGMRRRLLVAKAMVHSPPILVLDEPTAGVDVELRQQLWEYVRTLNARGTTIVLTTHYLEEAEAMCDRIAIINHGEVIACEPTPQLLARISDKRLVISPAHPVAEVPASLAGLNVERLRDGKLAVQYNPADTPVMMLIERIKDAGIPIADISTEESDLEDVFLQLTAK
ncbi:MAG: ABC transporter ATP-binding protein [Alphaproteobacteria bacterium]